MSDGCCLHDSARATTRPFLEEVKIYADFANDLAAFESIPGLLTSYTHPDAKTYVPQKAALFLSKYGGEPPAAVTD
jgi:hypothetical protein